MGPGTMGESRWHSQWYTWRVPSGTLGKFVLPVRKTLDSVGQKVLFSEGKASSVDTKSHCTLYDGCSSSHFSLLMPRDQEEGKE